MNPAGKLCAGDLRRVTAEIDEWGRRNFGEQQPWEKLLGMAEEYGEACEAMTDAEKYLDAIADSAIFLLHYIAMRGWDVAELVTRAFLLDGDVPGRPWPEQLGRLCRAELKAHQRIRGDAREHELAGKDAAAKLLRYWAREVDRLLPNSSLNHVIVQTWNHVCQRDWTRDPARQVDPQEID